LSTRKKCSGETLARLGSFIELRMSFRSRVDGILRTALEMRCFGMVGGAGSTGGLTCPPVSGFDPSAADGLAWSNVMSQVSSK
jgi:hypothetical protein